MYLMSSKYSEYLNLYLYLQIWKSTCTWLKYFEKYLTPTLVSKHEMYPGQIYQFMAIENHPK